MDVQLSGGFLASLDLGNNAKAARVCCQTHDNVQMDGAEKSLQIAAFPS